MLLLEYQNDHESNDGVPDADQQEYAAFRSRPCQAGEHQIQEHRCNIAADLSLDDVQVRMQHNSLGCAGGSVLEPNAASVDLHAGGIVHQVLGQ